MNTMSRIVQNEIGLLQNVADAESISATINSSYTRDSNHPASNIPIVTITSSDDVKQPQEMVPLSEEFDEEGVSTQEWEELSEVENTKKDTEEQVLNVAMKHTPVRNLDSELAAIDATDTIKSAIRILCAASTPAAPVNLNIERFPLQHTHSQPDLSGSALLIPGLGAGGDYDSDFSMTSGGLTDYDDCESSPRKFHNLARHEHADSDPTESISPRKKALKSLKSLKSSFRHKQRMVSDDDISIIAKVADENMIPTLENNTLGIKGKIAQSEMVPTDVHADDEFKQEKVSKGKENRKEKNGKSKWKKNRKKQLSRVAQKLSERQVISPSYKQKNDDFHKFFKDLPASERLLVDYSCALVKDILIQGRLYVSQNYLCFHSNILKWQTAVTVKLVEIDSMTKEKTVKVIPNAIQIILKDKTKMTFTSITARDRAYMTTFRLWQNILLEKPMPAMELWSQIHRNYGEELGIGSSDDDYVRPEQMPRKHQSFDSATLEGVEIKKTKKKKKSSNSTQTSPLDGELDKGDKKVAKTKGSISTTRHSSQDSSNGFHIGTDNSTADDKSIHSSQCTQEDISEDEVMQNCSLEAGDNMEDVDGKQEQDDEPCDFFLSDCAKVSLSHEYNTTAEDMFRIIFGDEDECSFWKETLVNKHSTDIDLGNWYDDDAVEGQRLRDLSYTLRLDNAIGPKTSHCKERQILYPASIVGKTYGVDCIVQNYGIPYADYFQTCMRYCIRKVTRDTCHVRVTSELRYKKTPWGLIKNFIEKNVASGLTDNFRKLEVQLQERIDFEKQQALIPDDKSRKSAIRRRRKKSEITSTNGVDTNSSADLTVVGSEERRGAKSLADVNNNRKRTSSSGKATPAVPPLLSPNGFIPNSGSDAHASPRLQFFSTGGRLIPGAIIFIFIVLLYSNYSMYQRLTTLEHAAKAAALADGVDPSVTAALLDRPGIPITSNPETLSAYLQAIDKRLRRLEDSMTKFAEDSGKKWDKMEHEWASLHGMIQTVLKQKNSRGG